MNWIELKEPSYIRNSHKEDVILLVVGRVLKNEAGELFLVGHINEQGGLCDDCHYDHAIADGQPNGKIVAYSDDLIEHLK